MRHHRFLLFGGNPIHQVNGLVLDVVVTGHLLPHQRDQICAQIKSARQEPKLLQDQLRALEPLGIFIVFHALVQGFSHLVAAAQLAFYDAPDRQPGIFTGKAKDFIEGAKEFVSFFSGKPGFSLWLLCRGSRLRRQHSDK